ncbi:MAG: sulfotransferase [Rhodospirillaceae bacterium]|nr:sulfotransferase [Rhodospirillaceae bacterium]
MLPKFLLIGAQKSATSLLQAALAEHPQVYLPRGEVPFFEDGDYVAGDLGPLERLYAAAPPGTLPGLKRPAYLHIPECTARIAAALPDAKLIVILRNPVDRAVSAYFHYMRHRSIPLAPLETGLQRILDASPAAGPRAREILEFGLYGKHLGRYFQHFDRRQFFIERQERFLADRLGTYRRLCGFLGVDPAFTPRAFNRYVNQGVYSFSRLRLQRLARALSHETFAGGMRHRLRRNNPHGLALSYAVRLVDQALRLVEGRTPPPRLSPALRERLVAYYRDDILRLEELLGEDLSAWRRVERAPAAPAATPAGQTA